MPHRTVRAVREIDGRLKLLEPVDLATGQVVVLTVDVPETAARAPVTLPTRKLGVPRTPITRDEIYADLGDK